MTASALLLLEVLERVRHAPDTPFIATYGAVMALTVLAGLTQTYGMIPFFVICGVYAFFELSERRTRPVNPLPLLALVIVVFLDVNLESIWATKVPHLGVLKPFGYLQLSVNMTPFYVGLWSLCFAVFIPLLAAIGIVLVRRREVVDRVSLALSATVAVFATLSFGYQFPEARFTFIYWALFLLACVSLAARARAAGAAWIAPLLAVSCLLSALSGLLILPGDTYGIPRLQGTRIAPDRTWLFTAITAEPLDRFHLQTLCGGPYDFCLRAEAGRQPTEYADLMFKEYKRRRTLSTRAHGGHNGAGSDTQKE